MGESHRQAELERIAGEKETDGKRLGVGVTLRAEPSNGHDPNAIRVEVMGQLLGYLARDVAATMSEPIRQRCGGVLEARGLIVGGWRDRTSEGHFGIRVWITLSDTDRLGLDPGVIDTDRRPATPRWPALPEVADGELRLSPTPADLAAERYGTVVTVIGEEHHQAAINDAVPAGWQPDRTWPVLVALSVAACNPHAKVPAPCVEVRIGDATVGYFTPAMTDRHRPTIERATSTSAVVTAAAQVARGVKSGTSIWRVKVTLASPES